MRMPFLPYGDVPSRVNHTMFDKFEPGACIPYVLPTHQGRDPDDFTATMANTCVIISYLVVTTHLLQDDCAPSAQEVKMIIHQQCPDIITQHFAELIDLDEETYLRAKMWPVLELHDVCEWEGGYDCYKLAILDFPDLLLGGLLSVF
jgi:hypothetical protein